MSTSAAAVPHTRFARITPYIAKKIQELQEEIRNSSRTMVRVTWRTGETIRVLARKDRVLFEVLRLKEHHETYYKRPFPIHTITILEVVNQNRLGRTNS